MPILEWCLVLWLVAVFLVLAFLYGACRQERLFEELQDREDQENG